MHTIAIVGAGPAGLAAAVALRDHTVTVIEKSRGVSGRAATRWRDTPAPDGSPFRWRYDHGAQYASPGAGSRSAAFIREHAGDGLTDLVGDVMPFDDTGAIRPDQMRDERGLRWTWPDGIAGLGRRLVEASAADLRSSTRATRIAHTADGWMVEAEDERLGPFDAVLLTPPAPQAADLLRASDLGLVDPGLAGVLGDVTYRSQFTVVWAFDQPLARPVDAYALVNAVGKGGGGGHDVAWLAVESDKPERAPDGASLLIAQMSDAWTETHYDDKRPDLVAAAARAVAGVWGPLPRPMWADTQRWRYSLPNETVDADVLRAAEAHGLFVAGDATAGKGRVHLAIEEGLAAADRIASRAA